MGLMRKLRTISLGAALVALLLVALVAPVANAQEDHGEEVYGRICAACHGSTGAGLSGTFPPLAGNDHVQDQITDHEARQSRVGVFAVDGLRLARIPEADRCALCAVAGDRLGWHAGTGRNEHVGGEAALLSILDCSAARG